ncbi:unnamed protein product [Eruca vesicaria subsp. sativa]|uniref:Uncharacterized protein n=1 Tax=Eruca vesicaria subsp. sativa TaxID=29727 RepID=A0ABC8IUE3_ERUVS|nr:unnamed protein product [Eruca vesicaria subsp. sativa]
MDHLEQIKSLQRFKDKKESRDRLLPCSDPGPRDENGDQRSRHILHLMEANKEEAVDSFEVKMKDNNVECY